MKTIITFISLFTFGLQSLSAQQHHDITIHFEGITSNKGTLFVGLYNSEANFLKERFTSLKTEIKDLKASVTFKNIPEGTYAISAYHDINNNQKLDTRFFVIPNEPVGTSNNAKGTYGAPKFKDAKFLLNKNLNITIRLETP